MKRPLVPLLVVASACACLAQRPNLLWLVAEDVGPEVMSNWGTPETSTPVLDRMAKEGVRYTRAYTTAPVCSPSRSAWMTGMYQTTIGAHHHRSHRSDGFAPPAGVRLLSERLRDAGYFTANVAKLPDSCGFKGTGKTDWNFEHTKTPFDSDAWGELKAHQPFYAQINFQETHRKFHAPAAADPAKIALPPYYPDHPVARQDWAAYLDAGRELDRKVGAVLRQLEADGLASNTIVVFFGDNGQSMVRGKQFCYEEGLHVPMIVRFPPGMKPPAHFEPGRDDPRFIEAIDLAPTMLALAGVKKPAGMQGRVFLGPDAEAPREFAFGARDRCDETMMRIRTVRDARHRYIRNFTPETPLLAKNDYKERSYPVWNLLKELHGQGRLTPAQAALCRPRLADEELYDLETDPHEIHNLATSDRPEDQAALKRLRGVLEQWIEATNDQGRNPEPESAAAGGRGAQERRKKQN